MTSTDSKYNSSKPKANTKNGSHHVIRENGYWAVKGTGGVGATFSTQADAIAAAKTIAKTNEEIIVHNSKGRKHTVLDSPADAGILQIWESIYRSQHTSTSGF